MTADSDAMPLARKITAVIEAEGPISVAHYMGLCLADPEFGYYKTREPFGIEGDFVTAPEVTQLFGEMVAIFLVHAWQSAGRPQPVRLVEIGPGRGTLMKDMLRVTAALAPELFAGMTVHLVETSPRLAAIQRETLAGSHSAIDWHRELEEVPEGHLLIAANELFDALPIHQFIRTTDGFARRTVALDKDGRLVFATGPGAVEPAMLPSDAAEQEAGTIFEASPAREAMMERLAARLVAWGGTVLAIDYGHCVTGYGDTLQALWHGRFDDPLAHPGEADLTSHVDFEVLARVAATTGAHVAGRSRQGEFLVGLGLLERAGRLGASRTEREQDAIRAAVERIAGEGEGRMGELFKVLAVTGKPMKLQPFSSPEATSERAGAGSPH